LLCRLSGRKNARIEPGPTEKNNYGRESPPFQPDTAPDGKYEQWKYRYTGPAAPRIGEATPYLFVHLKYTGNPPF
jgi:hypothetical protein